MEQPTQARHRIAYLSCVTAALVLGTWLRIDALQATLLADDYDHYAMRAQIYPVPRGPFDLFDFVGADRHERDALLLAGRLPWWSSANIELSVWRPLASALMSFDYAVLGGNTYAMHVHSMLWWGLLMLAVAALFASVLPLPVAGLALLLYACDEAHSLPVLWLANRSALIAVGIMVWGLVAHIAHRTRGLRGGAWPSLGCVALGLLAGEHAVGALAYFAIFELLGARDAWQRRVRALLPIAGLCTAYLVLRRCLGYGVAGSGFYIDPLTSPLRFLEASTERLPLLVGDLGLGLGAEWHFTSPPFRTWLLERHVFPEAWLAPDALQHAQLAIGVVALACALLLAVWLWRSPRVERAGVTALCWLWPGALLSLIPMCSTVPMSRLTLGAAVGADACIAFAVVAGLRSALFAPRGARSLSAGALVIALLLVHGIYAATRTQNEVRAYAYQSRIDARWVMEAPLDDARIAHQDLFVIASADWISQSALPYLRHSRGQNMPRSTQVLSGAFEQAHRLTRISERVLDLEILGRPTHDAFTNSVYRDETHPFRGGEHNTLPRFSVDVLSASRGQPTHLRLTFPKSVDDASYMFLYPHDGRLRRERIPAVGASQWLPKPSLPEVRERRQAD